MINREIILAAYKAITGARPEEALAILRGAPEVVQTETPFGSWLHVAATSGELQLTKELLQLGVEVNRRGGTFKGTALNLAASAGHCEVIEYLLSQGADMDTSEPERNPLFAAIYGGHIEAVKILVAHGINRNVRYSGELMNNMGAIEFATERGQTAIASYLRNLPGGSVATAA